MFTRSNSWNLMERSNRKEEMLNFTQHCDENEGFYAHSLGDVNAER
jgi:hypothetical protein